MATLKTTFFTAQEAAVLDSSKLVAPSGNLEFRQVPYTLTGAEAANDVLKIAQLPVGTTLIPSLCSVTCEDPGTALVLDVGTVEDVDSLADGIVLSAGGQIGFASALPLAVGALTKTPLPSRELIATVITATTLTAGAKLCFNIAYTPARF